MSDSPNPPEPETGQVLTGWLPRARLAAELGLSADTLARWGSMRIGPAFVRIGSRTYYRIGAVQDWLLSLEARRRNDKSS